MRTITELRGLSIEVDRKEGKQLSDGERLNGEEWHGSVSLCYQAMRQYPQPEIGREYGKKFDDHWTEWEDGKHTGMDGSVYHSKTARRQNLVRKNGQWILSHDTDFMEHGEEYHKVTAADIPK